MARSLPFLNLSLRSFSVERQQSVDAILVPETEDGDDPDNAIRGAAALVACLEVQLHKSYRQHNRALPPSHFVVLKYLRRHGFAIDVTQDIKAVRIDPPISSLETLNHVIDVYEEVLGGICSRALDSETQFVIRAPRKRDHESDQTRNMFQPLLGDDEKATPFLAAFASVLMDVFAESYRFENAMPSSRIPPLLHQNPTRTSNAADTTFYNVIHLEDYNIIAKRFMPNASLQSLQLFPNELTLAAKVKIKLSDFIAKSNEERSFQTYLVVDDGHDSFRHDQNLNRPIPTSSQWPRTKVALLPAVADNLLSVVPTRLTEYPNCCLLFHGCLHSSARAIDRGLRFDIGDGRLGPGFYLTSNPNEAKSYALYRLKQEQDRLQSQSGSSSSAAGSSPPPRPATVPESSSDDSEATHDAQFASNLTVSILVFVVKKADEIKRMIPYIRTPDANDIVKPSVEVALESKTFIVNPFNKFGNQYCFHGGTLPNLFCVGVHDIDAGGNILHTGIADTLHKGEERRGYRKAALS